MKISVIICEFNPFHNGHEYVISRAKAQNCADAVICVMGGSFTQRGDMAVLDKYARARHAVLGGADAVIELPAPFAVAPAEIFAKGAVKIISGIPAEATLVFGCEQCDKKAIENAARLTLCESEKFRLVLSRRLDLGESYIKSYCAAFEECGGDPNILSQPNNILGVEYVKAIIKGGFDIRFAPVERVGGGYGNRELAGKYSSASAIRVNMRDPRVKDAMPDYSYKDLVAAGDRTERFERLAADYLYLCDKANLKRVYGCGEGLENRLKTLSFGHGYGEIVELATGKRYSSARIKRIICANLLGLYADETEEFLHCDLPFKVLAVKEKRADEILPLFTDGKRAALGGAADGAGEKCWQINARAYGIWRHLNAPLACDNANEKMILV